MTKRSDRVADQVQRELAVILQRQLKDPRVRLATVSRVSLSGDLSHATVQVSVLGDEAERRQCVAALDHAKGFVRSALARRVHLRTVPELTFELDRGAEHSLRIQEILENLDDDFTSS